MGGRGGVGWNKPQRFHGNRFFVLVTSSMASCLITYQRQTDGHASTRFATPLTEANLAKWEPKSNRFVAAILVGGNRGG